MITAGGMLVMGILGVVGKLLGGSETNVTTNQAQNIDFKPTTNVSVSPVNLFQPLNEFTAVVNTDGLTKGFTEGLQQQGELFREGLLLQGASIAGGIKQSNDALVQAVANKDFNFIDSNTAAQIGKSFQEFMAAVGPKAKLVGIVMLAGGAYYLVRKRRR